MASSSYQPRPSYQAGHLGEALTRHLEDEETCVHRLSGRERDALREIALRSALSDLPADHGGRPPTLLELLRTVH